MKIFAFMLIGLIMYGTLFAQVSLDPRYHTSEEIYEELSQLQTDYPDLVYLTQIGTTHTDNLPIWAVKLSDNASVKEDEPTVMYAGQCHAEEVLGVEITMWMINDIIEHRFQNPYSIWLQYTQMWFVPTYNPEGLQVVMDGWDTSYRKNKTDNNGNGIFDYVEGPGNDIDGVDPNRNYGFNWVHGDTLYTPGGEELYDYYKGPYPFSEAGTQAIRDLAEQQHIIFSINWHSSRTGHFSQKVFYSFEWDGEKRSPDFELNELIGNTVAGLIETEEGGSYYEPSPSRGRKGSAHDWFYQAHGTTQLLIECGTQNLQPPAELVDDTCERCSVGAYYLINRMLGYQTSGAMLTGHITDENTSTPLKAEIIVEEKKASFFAPRCSDEDFGRFWRPLVPGSYTIKVRKKGYESQTLENIVIHDSGWTELDVQLVPLTESDVTGSLTQDGSPTDGTIVILGMENDTIDVTNGNISFTAYYGELNLLIYNENSVPQYFPTQINSESTDLNFNLQSASEIYTENWENGLSNWIIEGNWVLSDDSHSGSASLRNTTERYYSSNANDIVTTSTSIDLHGVSDDAILCFYHKYHIEHDDDNAFVEISSDGENWNVLKQFSGVADTWQREYLPLTDYSEMNIYLRFRFTSDATIVDPGWWIDDLKILANSDSISGEDEITFIPRLRDNYPNPFNPETHIEFAVNTENKVTELVIFNLKGQKIKTLIKDKLDKGKYTFSWNGTDYSEKIVASGIYFYKLTSGDFSKTKKMILLK